MVRDGAPSVGREDRRDLRRLRLAVLDHERPPGCSSSSARRDEHANHVEAVRAAVERVLGVVQPHLGVARDRAPPGCTAGSTRRRDPAVELGSATARSPNTSSRFGRPPRRRCAASTGTPRASSRPPTRARAAPRSPSPARSRRCPIPGRARSARARPPRAARRSRAGPPARSPGAARTRPGPRRARASGTPPAGEVLQRLARARARRARRAPRHPPPQLAAHDEPRLHAAPREAQHVPEEQVGVDLGVGTPAAARAHRLVAHRASGRVRGASVHSRNGM